MHASTCMLTQTLMLWDSQITAETQDKPPSARQAAASKELLLGLCWVSMPASAWFPQAPSQRWNAPAPRLLYPTGVCLCFPLNKNTVTRELYVKFSFCNDSHKNLIPPNKDEALVCFSIAVSLHSWENEPIFFNTEANSQSCRCSMYLNVTGLP